MGPLPNDVFLHSLSSRTISEKFPMDHDTWTIHSIIWQSGITIESFPSKLSYIIRKRISRAFRRYIHVDHDIALARFKGPITSRGRRQERQDPVLLLLCLIYYKNSWPILKRTLRNIMKHLRMSNSRGLYHSF